MSRPVPVPHRQPVTIHAGTLGRLGAFTRKALSFPPGEDPSAHAVLVLLGSADATSAANIGWRHFFVDRELPLLVLAGASADVGYYFVVNLFDRTTRAAFELAVGSGGLEVLMSAAHGGTSECKVTLAPTEQERVRADLRKFRGAQLEDSNAWFLRMFLAFNQLPEAVAQMDETFRSLARHEVIYLNGQEDLHGTAVQIALDRAVTWK